MHSQNGGASVAPNFPPTCPPSTGGGLRILIASCHPYIPELRGGAQSSTHELALALRKRGHAVAVVAGLAGSGWFGFVRRVGLKVPGRAWVFDRQLGYGVYRTWFPARQIVPMCHHFGPDVVMLQSGFPVTLAQALAPTGIPMVVYLHNVETDDLGGNPTALGNLTFIANSRFTADRFARDYGISSHVIYPMVDQARYATPTTRENVTFINPHPHKGVDIALGVAQACPDIPFVFVRAWTLSSHEEIELFDRLRGLPNVSVIGPTSDMKDVYGKCRIILAPSRWEEAFGRIAAEAHISGIPVVGSNRGGLPEAIGPGGVTLDIEAPVVQWAAAIRRLWQDEQHYAELSQAALRYAQREAMQQKLQVGAIEQILLRASLRQGGDSAHSLHNR